MAEIRYPIRAVARLTGIGVDRLRAWERRYGAVQPERGPRGRLYGEGEIRRLSLLRDAVERGHAIGQIAGMSESRLQRLLAPPVAATTRPAPAEDGLLRPLLDAVERLQYGDANQHLARLAVILSPRDLVHEAALPLIRAVGDGWQEGRFSVAQEHMASAILRNLLGGLVRLQLPHNPPATLLFATPAGEWHEFGILAAALLAASSGVGVVYLGPNLPSREIVDAARRSGARTVVLGVAEPRPPVRVLQEIRRIAKALPGTAELWVGGRPEALERISGNGLVRLADFAGFELHLRRLGGRI